MALACTRAKIDPPIGLHQLRHTFASLAVMNGHRRSWSSPVRSGTAVREWSRSTTGIWPIATSPKRYGEVLRASAQVTGQREGYSLVVHILTCVERVPA